jgi:hypothetical protein
MTQASGAQAMVGVMRIAQTSLAGCGSLYQSLDLHLGQIFPRTVGRIWQSSWQCSVCCG